jgi:regulator of sirC expression with transglutaminase-like and TPR domain
VFTRALAYRLERPRAESAVIKQQLIHSFSHAALSPDPDLAIAALMIARLEYPRLDAGPYLDRLDALGREASRRVAAAGPIHAGGLDPERYGRVMALNDYVFRELHFVGNEVQYEDPRNSFLNEVMDRRTGVPISLALLYIEVARRAGLRVYGINFPGHFLLGFPAEGRPPYTNDLILDPFHAGALLSQEECRRLLRRHAGEDAALEPHLFRHATKQQILARMLLNLKLVYVRMRSFPQARDVTELLLAVDPSAINELRDRGLLAYHLKDFSAALRDLQTYLQLSAGADPEQAQIWEHVKMLRRRVATLN